MVFIVKRFRVTKEVDIEGVGKGGAPVCVVMGPSFGRRTAVGAEDVLRGAEERGW